MTPLQFALVTSSYRGDLDRCRLLCDSIDRFVTGFETHYLLVEARDLALFKGFEGPRRRVVSERDLLPWWLRPVNHPRQRGRRLWIHPFGLPLHGWHVQQLRRFAMAETMAEAAMVSLDSDVVFVKPFDVRSMEAGGRVAFYRVPDGMDRVLPHLRAEHETWALRAARLIGLRPPVPTRTTYIGTLIAWRRDTVRDLLARIAAVGHRPAMMALSASRALSECTIYGRFVEEAEARPDRHAPEATQRCAVYWDGPPLDEAGLTAFLDQLAPHHVAIGLQSFTGTDPALIRRAVGL
ncbi:DUF6492 family protein [Aureimonas sp. Leaf324]|jgi:hypothetical protein|uniref:DUF6492 family protein n=1 Tax=Aureimonas sp. Leaf324 TaxID=1736336 RepID=UPI0006F1E89E|nr:DUF6492 family protein [Aureimonas sp. Leaf324]KQQ79059.1 hypothetical protein ASF65_14410 [Aureimonas sp. Leaf324]